MHPEPDAVPRAASSRSNLQLALLLLVAHLQGRCTVDWQHRHSQGVRHGGGNKLRRMAGHEDIHAVRHPAEINKK